MEKEFIEGLDNIFILGKGSSVLRCTKEKPKNSELWGCNNLYQVRKLDRLFIIHDAYLIQFRQDKKLIANINNNDFPVYTLGKYDTIKNNVQYPMEKVLEEYGSHYLMNTATYMLALAIMQKPKNLILLGVDMFWGTSSEYLRNEKSCVEFWLGVATGRGIEIRLAQESTVMKRKDYSYFYGFKALTDKTVHGLKLEPDYMWGKEKCAASYTIVKSANEV